MTYSIDSFIKNPLRDVLAEAVALTLDDLSEADKEQVSHFFEMLKANGVYQFFTKPSLEAIVVQVATNLAIRNFVLSLHERTVLILRTTGEVSEWYDGWVKPSVDSVLCSRQVYTQEDSLLPETMLGALSLPQDSLENSLLDNPWLISLYQAYAMGALALAFTLFQKEEA